MHRHRVSSSHVFVSNPSTIEFSGRALFFLLIGGWVYVYVAGYSMDCHLIIRQHMDEVEITFPYGIIRNIY